LQVHAWVTAFAVGELERIESHGDNTREFFILFKELITSAPVDVKETLASASKQLKAH